MGCAPSIHVSQSTGVVYCRDDSIRDSPAGANIRSLKQARATSLSISEVVSHIHPTHSESLVAETRILRIDKEKSSSLSGRGGWTEAETQTTLEQGLQQFAGMEKAVNGRELQFGPMKVYQQPTEILLVFGKEDQQTLAFMSAANQGGFRCKIANTSENAMDYYLKKQPQVILIDLRTTIYFEGETLCRNIRATRPTDNTLIIGIQKTPATPLEETSVLPLLRAGFNRRIFENHNPVACLNELLMLDNLEVASQYKIRASSCLFSALENTYDAVAIQSMGSEKLEFQYINPAYEKITGYWRSELSTISSKNSFTSNDNAKSDNHERISKQLGKGKLWEEVSIVDRKNGEKYVQSLKIVPILGSNGKVTHHVIIKRDITALHRDSQVQQMHMELQKLQSLSSPPDRTGYREHDSYSNAMSHAGGQLSRRQSTSAAKTEAPITKFLNGKPASNSTIDDVHYKQISSVFQVINMLNAVQESSPVNVVQVLERVIDILLRSTELFNPFAMGDKVEENVAESDLVEGLMHNIRRRHSGDANIKGHLLHRDSGHGAALSLYHLKASPEIADALSNDDEWEFNIINLEKVTNKRPLWYLGFKIFSRFNACTFLSISDDILRNWLQLIEANYHSSNTYHNSTHAADVLHATACFLQKDAVKIALEPLDEIAALIAAVVHDVDHPGFTNSFLCNEGNELAVLYNDIAVLESHHAAMAFKLTAKDKKSNIFQNLNNDDFKAMRQCIIDMIMATEMKQHFEHLNKFDNSLNKRHAAHDDTTSLSGKGTPESVSSYTPENCKLIKIMIIKCADIANPARPRPLCIEWANRIAEEYFRQSEEEKRRNLPIVMPVFDRQTCNVPKSQVEFIDFFITDLYVAWDKFAYCPEAMDYLNENYSYWKEEAERVEKSRQKLEKRRSSGLKADITEVQPAENEKSEGS